MERKIFALALGWIDGFPAFQLGDDGRPWPVVDEVIRLFEGEEPPVLALWFEVDSGSLSRRAPEERLATDLAWP